MNNDVEHSVLNSVFLYAKYYNFVNKQFEKNLVDFYGFLLKLSFTLYMELQITEVSLEK